MHRIACLMLLCACTACVGRAGALQQTLETLVQGEQAEREEAFQSLTQGPAFAADILKPILSLDRERGYPLVAVVASLGEGESVPLDLLADHLALFEWPTSHASQNVIIKPYVWHLVERRLVAAGPAAIPHLARALRSTAPNERKALKVADLMLAVGGHPAGEALAGLLDVDRDLGGVRVCDIAAAALLVLVRNDLPLRLADRDAMVKAAAACWKDLRGCSEEEWTRRGAVALAAQWKPEDLSAVRGVFEMLVGETVEDPQRWLAAHEDWMPARGPLDPDGLLPRLSGSRPEAFEANRRLEAMTGIRMWTPRARSFGALCASLRLWQPPPGLQARWRRVLKGSLVRLTVALVGYHEVEEVNGVIWAREAIFPAVEDRSVTGGGEIDDGVYVLHVQSRQAGTALIYNEHLSGDDTTRGRTARYATANLEAFPSDPMRSMVVLSVDEVSTRLPPRPPGVLKRDLRLGLHRALKTATGRHRKNLLLTLGYFQDDEDLEYLKRQKAAAPLLLLGDPAGLEGKPRLRPHEVEMALRKATDPDVRAYLDGLLKN